MIRRIATILSLCVVAALVPVASAEAAAPTISAPAAVSLGATVTITGSVGKAGAGQLVPIYFLKPGETQYVIRRTPRANAGGGYSATYVADHSYRVFSYFQGFTSRTLSIQLKSLTVTAPVSATVGSTAQITGTVAPAGATVKVYFHRSTDAPDKYTLRRTLGSDSTGHYSTSFVVDTSYRFYVTAAGMTTSKRLVSLSTAWLTALNSYRAAYRVPSVTESAALSAGDAAHARYMALTGSIGHFESPTSPYYSTAGDLAARRSNIALESPPRDSHGGKDWIDSWTTALFHELGALRPTLTRTGFAERSSATYAAAALDVLSERTRPDPGGWPRAFPTAASAFPFTTYDGGENPDPLSGCPTSFPDAPVSAPLIVSLGPSAAPITAAGATLIDRASGRSIPVCVLTESTYRNPADPAGQATGRASLAETHSIAVFGATPLSHRHPYRVTFTPNGRATITVNFSTS